MEPKNLRYAKSHEWAVLEGDLCIIGITKFAIDQLTDVVYIELPEVGDHVFLGESFGEIESVKAVSDLFSPLGGKVVEINAEAKSNPELVNKDPYGKGWLIRVELSDPGQARGLMDAAAYQRLISK